MSSGLFHRTNPAGRTAPARYLTRALGIASIVLTIAAAPALAEPPCGNASGIERGAGIGAGIAAGAGAGAIIDAATGGFTLGLGTIFGGLFGAVGGLFGADAVAAESDCAGSVFQTRDAKRWRVVWDRESNREARHDAEEACAAKHGTCVEAVTFRYCAATAHSSKRGAERYFWAPGRDAVQAQNAAMQICRNSGGSCTLYHKTYCNASA